MRETYHIGCSFPRRPHEARLRVSIDVRDEREGFVRSDLSKPSRVVAAAPVGMLMTISGASKTAEVSPGTRGTGTSRVRTLRETCVANSPGTLAVSAFDSRLSVRDASAVRN
jgi:hypothetical protein